MKPKEYLTFLEEPQTGKTKTWLVSNKISGSILAYIHWRPGWRRYVVRFENQVEFDYTCLFDLTHFLNNAMMQYNIRKEQADGKAKTIKGSKPSKGTRIQG